MARDNNFAQLRLLPLTTTTGQKQDGDSSKMTIGVTAYLRNLTLRLSRIARNCSDLKSASEVTRICEELVDKIEVLEKVFVVPERLK